GAHHLRDGLQPRCLRQRVLLRAQVAGEQRRVALPDPAQALRRSKWDPTAADPLEVDLRRLLLLLAGALPAAEKWHVSVHVGTGPAPARRTRARIRLRGQP